MRIAIIGAGIGGLAAAMACQRAGIDYELFDHAENPLSGGVALTLWPNALIALKDIGALEVGMDWLHFIEQGSLRTDRDAHLYQLPLQWMQSTYGFRPACVQRSELTARLYEALGEPMIHKSHCDRVEWNEQSATVCFSDGLCDDFDGVVAADGIHSVVRHQLVGDTARLTDYTAWRGIAVDADVPAASMAEYMGPGIRFGYATISRSLTYWFATANNHLFSPKDPKDWSIVAERFSEFPETVLRCIERTSVEGVVQSLVQDVSPGVPMAFGHVAVIGDAAHAITPNLGLGACLALEDAKCLFEVFRADDPLEKAFESYARARRVRVATIAKLTRSLGQTMQFDRLPLMRLRNTAIQAIPDTVARFVWRRVLG